MRNTDTQIHTCTRTNTCNLCYSWVPLSYGPGVNPHHDCLLINPGLVRSLRPPCFIRVCRPLTHLILPLSASVQLTGAAFNSRCCSQPFMHVTFIWGILCLSPAQSGINGPFANSKILAFAACFGAFCNNHLMMVICKNCPVIQCMYTRSPLEIDNWFFFSIWFSRLNLNWICKIKIYVIIKNTNQGVCSYTTSQSKVWTHPITHPIYRQLTVQFVTEGI